MYVPRRQRDAFEVARRGDDADASVDPFRHVGDASDLVVEREVPSHGICPDIYMLGAIGGAAVRLSPEPGDYLEQSSIPFSSFMRASIRLAKSAAAMVR